MADYSSPTIVRPNIPADAITMLELMVLTQMYDWERAEDTLFLFAQEGVPSEIQLDIHQVRDLVDAAPEGRSNIIDVVRQKVATLEQKEGMFDLAITDLEDAAIFQDILHRCPDIDHFTIVSGWTCSRMRSDGFGGRVVVITRDHIQTSNTNDMERELLLRAEYGEILRAPGHGEHRVLMLAEERVRAMAADIEQVALDREERVLTATDADIRDGCLEAISTCRLEAFSQNLAFSAAQAAMRIALQRAD